MSEDRTQEPSKLRRQQARERGQVAHSAELTGSVGLLAAVVMLGFWGNAITAALVALVREPLNGTPIISADPSEVVARLRQLAFGVIWPLLPVVGGFVLGGDRGGTRRRCKGSGCPACSRLTRLDSGPSGKARGSSLAAAVGVWSLIKAVAIVAVAAWSIRHGWLDFQRFGAMDTPALARAVGGTLWLLVTWLATATLVLGLIDFALQYRRYEDLLRTTSEEHREDQRSAEGDPAPRSKSPAAREGLARRLARAAHGGLAHFDRPQRLDTRPGRRAAAPAGLAPLRRPRGVGAAPSDGGRSRQAPSDCRPGPRPPLDRTPRPGAPAPRRGARGTRLDLAHRSSAGQAGLIKKS